MILYCFFAEKIIYVEKRKKFSNTAQIIIVKTDEN